MICHLKFSPLSIGHHLTSQFMGMDRNGPDCLFRPSVAALAIKSYLVTLKSRFGLQKLYP